MATIEKLTEEEKLESDKKRKYEEMETQEQRDIRSKLVRIVQHYRDNIFPDQFEIVKAKKLYSKEYEALIERLNLKNKSAKIYPLIASIHDTFMTSLYDNDLRPKVFPMEDTEPKIANDAEHFFQWGIEVSDAEKALEVIRDEATLIGASYGIPGYYTSKVTINEEEKNIFIPTLNYASYFEVFYSVGARDFYKAPEKFRRRFLAFDDLEFVYGPLWDNIKEEVEKKKDYILNHGQPLSTADFTKIYDIDNYSSNYLQYKGGADGAIRGDVYEKTFDILSTSSYCEVVELYIRDQMMIFVNGYTIYSGDSPFKYATNDELSRQGPFIEMTYEKGIGSMPRGIGHKIMGHQKQCNALYNSIGDAIYKHLNPMYTMVQGALLDPSTGQAPTSINYAEGVTLTVNQGFQGAIGKLDFTDYNILQIANNFLESVKQDAYTICGVNSYVLGGEGKVERSRFGTEQKVNASKARLNPIMKSIGRFYTTLFYHWIGLSSNSNSPLAYISKGDERYAVDLNTLNKKLKIVCTADAAMEETRASKVQGVLTMMQNIQPLLMDEITQLPGIDKKTLLEQLVKIVGIEGFKAKTVEDHKKYIDESYEIKSYLMQKDMELQQIAQQAQQPQEPAPQPEEPQPETNDPGFYIP